MVQRGAVWLGLWLRGVGFVVKCSGFCVSVVGIVVECGVFCDEV